MNFIRMHPLLLPLLLLLISCSSGSDPVHPTVSDTSPPVWDAAVGITSVVPGENSVTIHWGSASDAEHPPVEYLVYMDTDEDLWNTEPVIRTSIEPYIYKNLACGTEYWFGVRCRDSSADRNTTVNDYVMEAEPEGSGWGISWGGAWEDKSFRIAIDSEGCVYVTGAFCETVDFDPGEGVCEITSNDEHDAYLSKFARKGNHVWTRTWGGERFASGRGITVDSEDNVYVTGYFMNTADLDPGPGMDVHTAIGYADVSVSKFDPDGNYIWGRVWGGEETCCPEKDEGLGVAVDKSGNVFVTGRFTYTVDFDPGPGVEERTANTPENKKHDTFISRFDSEGNFQWVRTWGDMWEDCSHGIALDESGNIYVTGVFNGYVDFDPSDAGSYVRSGIKDAFLSSFDSEGNHRWAMTWGGPDNEEANDIAIDADQNILVTGTFWGDIDFDPGQGTALSSAGLNGNDAYLVRYTPEGTLDMVRTWGHGQFDGGQGVDVSVGGDIYVSGMVGGVEGMDGFLMAFDGNGMVCWGHRWGGPLWDWCCDVKTGPAQNVYVTGYFDGESDLDPSDGSSIHNSAGAWDSYLARYLPDGTW